MRIWCPWHDPPTPGATDRICDACLARELAQTWHERWGLADGEGELLINLPRREAERLVQCHPGLVAYPMSQSHQQEGDVL